MTTGDGAEALAAALDELDARLGASGEMAAGFSAELERLRIGMGRAGREAEGLGRSLSAGLERALEGVAFGGLGLGEAAGRAMRSLTRSLWRQATRPLAGAAGALISDGLAALIGGRFAAGGAISDGRVMAFARGGVVDRPTLFGMRGGLGLMGEAGPEAILPLARGPDGRLGVQAAGGGRPVQVSIEVRTPDAEGFRRSQSQIAAELARLIRLAERNR
ncbi:MAG: phage tail tape measure protein [Alphaproteobacteria bacterium]|nr:MAG: phage tail tape measure protein [Alphaproteobacteria bacterium]